MDKIMPYLQELAQKLGVAVEHLWGVMVKQSYADGVSDLFFAGIDIIVLILMFVFSPKVIEWAYTKYKNVKQDRIENGTGYHGSYEITSSREDMLSFFKSVLPILMIIFGLIFIIDIAINIPEGLKHLYNPEYYALQEIIENIGTK